MSIGKWVAGALGALAVSIGSSIAVAGSSSTVSSVTVAGTDAIFLAGRTDVTIAPPGVPPPGYPLVRNSPPGPVSEAFPMEIPAATGASFQFSASGIVSVDTSNNVSAFGPDGTTSPYIAADGLAGISGYTGPTGALVGVFLNANDPENSTPPATLNFEGSATSFSSLSPALGQTFFIGDGLTGTGTGTTQTFFAPNGATRLFLGIADASGNSGPPGGYDDNGGSFSVSVTSTGVPEPSNVVLLTVGGLVLLTTRRNRLRQVSK